MECVVCTPCRSSGHANGLGLSCSNHCFPRSITTGLQLAGEFNTHRDLLCNVPQRSPPFRFIDHPQLFKVCIGRSQDSGCNGESVDWSGLGAGYRPWNENGGPFSKTAVRCVLMTAEPAPDLPAA